MVKHWGRRVARGRVSYKWDNLTKFFCEIHCIPENGHDQSKWDMGSTKSSQYAKPCCFSPHQVSQSNKQIQNKALQERISLHQTSEPSTSSTASYIETSWKKRVNQADISLRYQKNEKSMGPQIPNPNTTVFFLRSCLCTSLLRITLIITQRFQ